MKPALIAKDALMASCPFAAELPGNFLCMNEAEITEQGAAKKRSECIITISVAGSVSFVHAI